MSRPQREESCRQGQNEPLHAHGPRRQGNLAEFVRIQRPYNCPRTETSPQLRPGDAFPASNLDLLPWSPPNHLRRHTQRQIHNLRAEGAHDDQRIGSTVFEPTADGGRGQRVAINHSKRSSGRGVRPDDLQEVMGPLLSRLDELPNRTMPALLGAPRPFIFLQGQAAGGSEIRQFHSQRADPHSMRSEGLRDPRADDGRRGGQPLSPFDSLDRILNLSNIRPDRDDSEMLDRMVRQLSERDNASPGPPPASGEAILSLKKKKVDGDMLGEEGKAE
ncbi:uncharacterized protein PV07_12778, partial [Cladophialophora immunda]